MYRFYNFKVQIIILFKIKNVRLFTLEFITKRIQNTKIQNVKLKYSDFKT
jgi:hypothetical protein